jgi:hypothetical protein
MHGDIGLSPIGMTEDFVASGLPHLLKTRAKALGRDLTRGAGHPESRYA